MRASFVARRGLALAAVVSSCLVSACGSAPADPELGDAPPAELDQGLEPRCATRFCLPPETVVSVLFGVGAIDAKAKSYGTAALGKPLGPEQVVADGAGRRRDFEHGTILWSLDAGGAFVIKGGILDLWKRLGGETGKLGFPMEDQGALPSGYTGQRFQPSQGVVAAIYWDKGSKSWEVCGPPWPKTMMSGCSKCLTPR